MVTETLIHWTIVIGPLVGLLSVFLYLIVVTLACENKDPDNLIEVNLLHCQVKNESLRSTTTPPMGDVFISDDVGSLAWQNIKNKVRFFIRAFISLITFNFKIVFNHNKEGKK